VLTHEMPRKRAEIAKTNPTQKLQNEEGKSKVGKTNRTHLSAVLPNLQKRAHRSGGKESN
jgi:hypothetical protein